jgi:Flavoprotein
VTERSEARVLYAIVCGAGPAGEVGRLVEFAQERDWDVQVIATPAALGFIDIPSLEAQTGRPVRSQYRSPDEPRSPRADAIVVAPATYNTINKWAAGASDTYALGLLAEATGLDIPVVVLPFVNRALASRAVFTRSIDELRGEGVHILLGEPHSPGSGGELIATFPWKTALKELERIYGRTHGESPVGPG